MSEIPKIGTFRLFPDAKKPVRMTAESACHDVFTYLKAGMEVTMYDGYNQKHKVVLTEDKIDLLPFCRYLIPTGCKFKIPSGHSIRIHPRSGNSLKLGLTLPNCEGIIDADYPEQTFGLISNLTFVTTPLLHLERMCQCELVTVVDCEYVDAEDFEAFTDRVSGLGHTGSK